MQHYSTNDKAFLFSTMILIFNTLLLLMNLTATPIQNSFLKPSQSKSYSHPLPNLEKRGGSVSSRSSSSLDSGTTNPPDAPVLKTDAIDEGNQDEKRKRVIEQRLKRNKARRNIYASKMKELKANPTALKSWRLKIKEASALKRKKRKVLFDNNPAAKTAWKLKDSIRNAEYRLKKMMEKIKADSDEKEKELYMKKAGAEIYSHAKIKRLASFVADPAKQTAWKLKIRNANARSRLKRKIEAQKKRERNVANESMKEGNNFIEISEEMFDGHSDTEMIDDVVSENEENFNMRIEEMFEGNSDTEMIEELFDWNTESEMIEEERTNVISEYEFNDMTEETFV
jgi:hypothetical protein